jgi:hypothetical protein
MYRRVGAWRQRLFTRQGIATLRLGIATIRLGVATICLGVATNDPRETVKRPRRFAAGAVSPQAPFRRLLTGAMVLPKNGAALDSS